MVQPESYQKSIFFMKQMFKDYYSTNEIILPDRFSRREYAFVFFGGKGMVRHLAFGKKHLFSSFVQDRVPQHSYYSSAYYKYPDAPTMQEKEWMGAELIFDLDSDHLPNADKMGYEESLAIVKQEFKKLVEEFLITDFGFEEKYLELYFSGGRGYHCHVKDPQVFDLESNERREIVDYITARDLLDDTILRERAIERTSIHGRSFASMKSLRMPNPNEPGWKGRISRSIIDILNDIRASENPEEKLREYGVSEKDAIQLSQHLSDERMDRIKDGLLDQSRTLRKFFLNRALRKSAVSLSAGETDEPVTCDVKRLIRLPGSLHGKTGLQVVQITLNKLDRFDPLDDAVIFDDAPVRIEVPDVVNISMCNEDFSLGSGVQEVPKYVAVFLVGKNLAFIP
ncbi:MAG: DNA primase catalytic subunit PriS [Candidatus Thermoplasmatota archaeon]|nr:DNA primase catalytic subunit PriS [Candidatus Thermoplasmatota archaeon]MBU1941187.1 DNA primase catalytic subunit PriS [Candidatus Thermoplasmatota archaeon]